MIYNEEIIKLNIDSYKYLNWVQKGLLIKDSMILPPKISMSHREGYFYNIMPCIIPEESISGIKVVTRYPERTPTIEGDIFLYDLKTGSIIESLQASYITNIRTAAVAVHSIQLLARKNFETIGWIGLGEVAKETVKLFLETHSGLELLFYIHEYKDKHTSFVEYIQNLSHTNKIKFKFSKNYDDVISNSDILISAVSYISEDFTTFENIKEGSLIVPIHTRGFVDIDFKFDKIFCDDIDHVKGFKNFNKYKGVTEVKDVISNKNLGRKNNNEKIIVYNIGIALHDIYFSKKIIELLKR